MIKNEAVKTALRTWARTPFVWGKADCMLSIADYLIDASGGGSGVDCACRFRGKYKTRLGCARVSGFHKDPVKPFADCVAEIPLKETDEPAFGDVGVVDFGGVIAGAICLGAKWATRQERGLFMAAPTKILKAWAV